MQKTLNKQKSMTVDNECQDAQLVQDDASESDHRRPPSPENVPTSGYRRPWSQWVSESTLLNRRKGEVRTVSDSRFVTNSTKYE